MSTVLEGYARVVGDDVIDQLRQLAQPLKGKSVVHVNSTRVGGGVAEILNVLIPLMRELEIDASWEVISGEGEFFDCTKRIHNALQGAPMEIPETLWDAYDRTNEQNAEQLRGTLEEADIVFIHDPQPASLRRLCKNKKGKWIWRCHIDASRPYRAVWKRVREYLAGYDASIFSLADFAQPLPYPQYLIPPSIDPLSDKNKPLPSEEIAAIYSRFDLDRDRPMVLQVSRFDRFKDPVGVIQAYRLAKSFMPSLQLVLAGGSADDDPEGEAMLNVVETAAAGDPDIRILMLPNDAHRDINALQRAADVVLQKSIREGFGLTVTEAMWKTKPVIGGNTGGIRMQVINHHTGFLVSSPEGAALRLRYLLAHRNLIAEMGEKAREFVRENFLIMRHMREHLTLMVALLHGNSERIELE